jgi:hypothetical protein
MAASFASVLIPRNACLSAPEGSFWANSIKRRFFLNGGALATDAKARLKHLENTHWAAAISAGTVAAFEAFATDP